MKTKLKLLSILIPVIMLCIAGYQNFYELKYSAQLNELIIELSDGNYTLPDADEMIQKEYSNLRLLEILTDAQVKILYLKYIDCKSAAVIWWVILIFTILTFGAVRMFSTPLNFISHEKDKVFDAA